jgi:hypothetical protein
VVRLVDCVVRGLGCDRERQVCSVFMASLRHTEIFPQALFCRVVGHRTVLSVAAAGPPRSICQKGGTGLDLVSPRCRSWPVVTLFAIGRTTRKFVVSCHNGRVSCVV